jgi:hypothetical protein
VRVAPVGKSIRLIRRRHRRAARAIAELARECVERHPEGSFEAFTARETLWVYLPETLTAYLAVPPAMRRVRSAERPSADDELSRQLKTLYAGLERIREADAESGAQRMAVNAAFLNERFGSTSAGGAPERRSVLAELVEVVETAFRRI